MMKPRMIFMVGCSGSGKTYIVHKLFADGVRVDVPALGISEALHAVRSALNSSHDVVIDGGVNTREARTPFLTIANKYDLDLVFALHIDVSNVEVLSAQAPVDVPTLGEGFGAVVTCKNRRDAELLSCLF